MFHLNWIVNQRKPRIHKKEEVLSAPSVEIQDCVEPTAYINQTVDLCFTVVKYCVEAICYVIIL